MQDHAEDIDAKKMALLEHLIELRTRLMYAAGAILVAFLACYAFADDIYAFLVRPLADVLNAQGDGNRRLIFTALHEVFFSYIKVAFFAGLFLAFPMVAAQIWMFIAPGLYKHEKKAFLPFLFLTPILFFMGGALVYYGVFPLAWKFFIGFEQTTGPDGLPIQLEAKVGEYLSLVIKLIFAFGISFQLPLLLTLLARVGLATSRGLAAKRKYAIVIVFVVAAVLTPPDVITQIGLAVPIMILYEISIVAVRAVERKKAANDPYADDDEIDETDFNET